MKRLAKRTLVIAAVLTVLAIVVGGTAYGYFFSGQTIANNKIKTGNITLQLNDGGAVLPIDLDNGANDIMPGSYGTVGNYHISNIGTTHASLYVGITPNGEYDSNLADVLVGAFWLDAETSVKGVWDAGDAYFVPNGQYVSWTAADGASLPAAAFKPMSVWRSSLSNTMNVEVGNLGYLQFSYSLPSTVVDTVEKPLMGKSVNFNMVIQLDQYHDLEHKVFANAGETTHPGGTMSLYRGGFLVSQTTINPNGSYELWAPSNSGYTLIETWTGGSWTKPDQLDISSQDAYAPGV